MPKVGYLRLPASPANSQIGTALPSLFTLTRYRPSPDHITVEAVGVGVALLLCGQRFSLLLSEREYRLWQR